MNPKAFALEAALFLLLLRTVCSDDTEEKGFAEVGAAVDAPVVVGAEIVHCEADKLDFLINGSADGMPRTLQTNGMGVLLPADEI